MQLDKIDHKILQLLQGNARLSMTALAEKVGLSVSLVTERVCRLEQSGVILRYQARLNPAALGLGLLVFVELKLHTKLGHTFDDFRREVRKIPQVL